MRQHSAGSLSDEPSNPPIDTTRAVFAGKVWNVVRETFDYNGQPIIREFVDHTGAVAVLAMDERERVLLIRQYRHPVRHATGRSRPDSSTSRESRPRGCGERELAEEADLEADDWSVLAEFYTSPGGSNEAIRIYLARGIRPTATPFDRTDEEADIEVRWVPLDELVEDVLARRLQNPSLMVGVLAARASRDEGWTTLGPRDLPWSRNPTFGAGAEH